MIRKRAAQCWTWAVVVGAATVLLFLPIGTAVATPKAPAAVADASGDVCDQAIAEAGTGTGRYGHYQLVLAPGQGGPGADVVVGTSGPDHLVGGSGMMCCADSPVTMSSTAAAATITSTGAPAGTRCTVEAATTPW